MNSFRDLFGTEKPVIAALHLMALPGSPLYGGSMDDVFRKATEEADLLVRNGIGGLIVENFRDRPFYPGRIPAETVAALAAIGREVISRVSVPVGINALRNDGESAVAIAAAIGAHFVRINVHMGAVVSEQGIIEGVSHRTLRLRNALKSEALIFADVGVKHAAPLAERGLAAETRELTERGLVDAVIVSGEMTGEETDPADVDVVRKYTALPILIGSGATPENLDKVFARTDGFIVGSYFKKDGVGDRFVEEERVKRFMEAVRKLKN
jgi:membrane complex biogenesis BtpA family protein